MTLCGLFHWQFRSHVSAYHNYHIHCYKAVDIIQFSGSGPGKLILAHFFCAVHCDQPLGSQLRDSEMLFIFQTIQMLEFLLSRVCKLGMNRPRQGCFRRWPQSGCFTACAPRSAPPICALPSDVCTAVLVTEAFVVPSDQLLGCHPAVSLLSLSSPSHMHVWGPLYLTARTCVLFLCAPYTVDCHGPSLSVPLQLPSLLSGPF